MTAAQATAAPFDERGGYRRGVLLVLLAGVCWSTMGIGVRLMEAADAWQILFYRSIALTLLLLVVLWARPGGRSMPPAPRVGLGSVLGGLALVGAFSGGVIAVQLTSVANALFLFAAAPFFAALLGSALLGETVRPGTWKAMAIAVLGIAAMVANSVAVGGGSLLGNLLALGSALSFALFTIALRRWRAGDMLPAVLCGGVFTMLAAAVGCILSGEGFAVSSRDLTLAMLLGFVQVGLGMVLCTIGSRTVPAAEVALLTLSEVLLGPFWVWLVLAETPSTPTVFGGGLLLAALVMNALSGIRRRPPPLGRV